MSIDEQALASVSNKVLSYNPNEKQKRNMERRLVQHSFTSGVGENDCLSLEDKLLYGHLRRQVDITHFIGDAALERFLRTDVLHV